MADTSDLSDAIKQVAHSVAAHQTARTRLYDALSVLLGSSGLEVTSLIPTERGWALEIVAAEGVADGAYGRDGSGSGMESPDDSDTERRRRIRGRRSEDPKSVESGIPEGGTSRPDGASDVELAPAIERSIPLPIIPATGEGSAIAAPSVPATGPAAKAGKPAMAVPLPVLEPSMPAAPAVAKPVSRTSKTVKDSDVSLPEPIRPLAAGITVPDVANMSPEITQGYMVPPQGVKRDNPLRAPVTDPKERARTLARTLIGEITTYRAKEHKQALSQGIDELRMALGKDIERARTQFMRDADPALGDEREQIFIAAVNAIAGRGQALLPIPSAS